MSNHLNTLAEIQRLCRKISSHKDGNISSFIKMVPNIREYTKVPHPSEDFEIWTNGTYYLVNDHEEQTLYKLINPLV